LHKIDVSDPKSEPSALKVVLDLSDAVTIDVEEVRGVFLSRGLLFVPCSDENLILDTGEQPFRRVLS